MGMKVWTLGLLGALVGMGLLPGVLRERNRTSCSSYVLDADLHSAGMLVLEWVHVHGDGLPKQFNGECMQDWHLHARTFVDAWGRAYLYKRSTDGVGFFIRSLGKDGKRGGVGLDTDKQVLYDSRSRKLMPFSLVLVTGGPDQTPELQWQAGYRH
jgi:hypothetical protein